MTAPTATIALWCAVAAMALEGALVWNHRPTCPEDLAFDTLHVARRASATLDTVDGATLQVWPDGWCVVRIRTCLERVGITRVIDDLDRAGCRTSALSCAP